MRSWMTLRRLAVTTWALALAIAVNLFFTLRWWHPACMDGADGPVAYGYGIPLPYREPSIVFSMSERIMPHLYALDTLLLTALFWCFLNYGQRPRVNERSSKSGRIVTAISAIGGVLFLLAMLTLQGLVFSVVDWFPVAALPTGADRYVDYRPVFTVDAARDGACH